MFLQKLQLVQKGTKLVLEQVTTTIAAVADTAEDNFIQFYDQFMPSLKYIIEVRKEYDLMSINYSFLLNLVDNVFFVIKVTCWRIN